MLNVFFSESLAFVAGNIQKDMYTYIYIYICIYMSIWCFEFQSFPDPGELENVLQETV